MKSENTSFSSNYIHREPSQEPSNSKLLSVLALTAGAMAAPGAAHGAIVVTTINQTASVGNPVTVDLPGNTTDLTFTASVVGSLKLVGVNGGAGSQFASIKRYNVGYTFAKRATALQTWNAVAAGLGPDGLVVLNNVGGPVGPGNFSDTYIAIKFGTGGGDRFGFVHLLTGDGNVPSVNVSQLIYDDSGALNFAPVPELGTGAWGALVLGAVGLRAWRARKSTPEKKA